MCAAVYRYRHLVRATKVNAGLAESNGRLLLGIWRDSLHVTCGLTACTPGSAPGPTLVNEYGKTLLSFNVPSGACPTLLISTKPHTRKVYSVQAKILKFSSSVYLHKVTYGPKYRPPRPIATGTKIFRKT